MRERAETPETEEPILCADIHSHIVYDVDDGAQTLQEALALLRLDWEEGARVVYATPHYGWENVCAPDAALVRQRFLELKAAAAEELPGMRLCLGTEWYCADDLADRVRRGEAWPMEPGDWVLTEFLEWGDQTEPAEVMLRRLKTLREQGVRTNLAHPERYRALQADWEAAKRICDLGVLLQVNAFDLALNPNEATRGLAQWMATEQLISFIGSDMHGTREGKRVPKLREGIRWLYAHTDPAYADAVVRGNAERILGAPPVTGDETAGRRKEG